ncbi:hypothetical protein [Caballeronia sp. LZ028]|uniref:hypothetical protein n=1 Tax=Caballeronia sp. LZ028 TaxID=3038563 RepID=UPI00285EDB63|nr:hypothetical protein [Caballeronia sp. LZ028]MDR5765005.1 hypothetical protein [Caballeronia sp. LZ028]
MTRLIKMGNHEYHVVVHPLLAGGFAFTVVDIDLTGPKVTEARHDSETRFPTEQDAYERGSVYARRRARLFRR